MRIKVCLNKRDLSLNYALKSALIMVVSLSLVSCMTSSRDQASSGSQQTGNAKSPVKNSAHNRSDLVKLGPGDEVEINVWRNSDVSKTVALDKAGYIDVPVAGRVKAIGLTLPELKKELVVAYSEYIVNPRIDLSIETVVSQKLYVFGEVVNPGAVTLEQDLMAWEVISRVGGFTDDANRRNVVLLREKTKDKAEDSAMENESEKVEYLASIVNLDMKRSIKKGHNIEGQDWLLSGDILYVPRKKIADVEEFMNRLNNILNPVSTMERIIIMGPDVVDVLKGEYESGSDVIIAP